MSQKKTPGLFVWSRFPIHEFMKVQLSLGIVESMSVKDPSQQQSYMHVVMKV